MACPPSCPLRTSPVPALYSPQSWFSECFGGVPTAAQEHCMAQDTVDLLLKRRSAKPALLAEPGPTREQLDTILTAAGRVPDHKKLEPWRFIVFEGEARAGFGRILLKACLAEEKQTPVRRPPRDGAHPPAARPDRGRRDLPRDAQSGRARVGADPVLRRRLLQSVPRRQRAGLRHLPGSPSGIPTAPPCATASSSPPTSASPASSTSAPPPSSSPIATGPSSPTSSPAGPADSGKQHEESSGCSTRRARTSMACARSLQGAGRSAPDRLDIVARQERDVQSGALQLLQRHRRAAALRDVQLGGPQGLAPQHRRDRRVRVLARHLGSALQHEHDVGVRAARRRRVPDRRPHRRAEPPRQAAARQGEPGRLRVQALEDHRPAAAGPGRQVHQLGGVRAGGRHLHRRPLRQGRPGRHRRHAPDRAASATWTTPS